MEGSIRQRILEAALDLAESDGYKSLTQPRIAKAAGVRQSHLTYYFPRKADLFIAMLEAAHERAARTCPLDLGTIDGKLAFMHRLMFDRKRMRFFLGIVLEVSEEPELRPILEAHTRELAGVVAGIYARTVDDEAVLAFVDRLRGMGLRHLLEPGLKADKVDMHALAASCGLHAP
ncbi:MAG: TetR/AcrR family transcriptional regulator [Xanthobacter sp.]